LLPCLRSPRNLQLHWRAPAIGAFPKLHLFKIAAGLYCRGRPCSSPACLAILRRPPGRSSI
jgi:hypothetical protein